MADMHTHLLPCPHCGGEAEFSQTGRHEMTLKCVGVQPSGLRGCGPLYRQRVLPNRHTLDWLQGVMAETWNRRTPSHDAETIKALREALDGCVEARMPGEARRIARAALAGRAS